LFAVYNREPMLQTKAIYNLLRLQADEDPSVKAEEWALEDLRPVSLDALFSRLKKYQVEPEKGSFQQFARQCETPEELSDLLFPDSMEESARDPFYLLIFELWRRLLPEKQSLSIFCDELDHRIALYDQGLLESDEPIQDALTNLLEVLDENADSGVEPEQVLAAISDYCAHDQIDFLYDYISDLLDEGNSLYASELIEGFYPYAPDNFWFDFFRIRLLALTDIGDANAAAHRLLENELSLPLLLEMLRFLASGTERELFTLSLKKAAVLVKDQEELIEMLAIMADYYEALHEDDLVKSIQKLMDSRQEGPPRPSDFQILQKLIK